MKKKFIELTQKIKTQKTKREAWKFMALTIRKFRVGVF